MTASGFQDQLAVVTHVSDCLPSNDQVSFETLSQLGSVNCFKAKLTDHFVNLMIITLKEYLTKLKGTLVLLKSF